MKATCTILLLMMSAVVNSQNTITFKGQVYHNKLGPQKNLSILVDNQYPAVTNDAGVFIISLPKNTNRVKVSLSKSNYNILFPFGGLVLLPRDPNDVPQIIIGNVQENAYMQQYLSLYRLIKNRPVSTGAPIDVQGLKNKMDSLQKLLIQLNYTETELRTAKELQDGKDNYLPEINGDLADFKIKAADLKTAFKYVSDYAFENPAALERLATAINNYNIAFNNLERQRVNYEKRIADYWQDESLTTNFRSLSSLALDTIHRQKIYPMQETIGQIRDYLVRGNKNAGLKKSIQDNIARMVQDLEALLPRFETEVNQMSAALLE
jgi:hypothetical protein